MNKKLEILGNLAAEMVEQCKEDLQNMHNKIDGFEDDEQKKIFNSILNRTNEAVKNEDADKLNELLNEIKENQNNGC